MPTVCLQTIDGSENSRSLAGREVIVTRTTEQSAELVELLEQSGATVYSIPTIQIAPPTDRAPLESVIAHLEHFDWILFTSSNSVRALFSEFLSPLRPAMLPQMAVVGDATARVLASYGYSTAVCGRGNGLDLASMLPLAASERVLLPQSSIATGDVAQALRRRGATVHELVAYRTISNQRAPMLLQKQLTSAISAVLFTSPSTVKGFLDSVDDQHVRQLLARGLKFVCIGETTAQSLESLGYPSHAAAAGHTAQAMVNATIEVLTRESQHV